METQKPLLKDEDGEEVDVHMYRSMIGSLMYLTSLRPDIMFAVCACARYQVNQKVSHLHAVKRIFSDYAGASLDRKSTTGGCQFLGCRLISWQCKKQTVIANSITEAEYGCFKLLWTIILNTVRKSKESVKLMMEKLFRMELELMLFWSTVKVKTINGEAQLHVLVDDKKIIITEASVRRDLQLADEEDEAVYKELGDSLVRAATTASSLEAEQDRVLDLEKTKTTQQNKIDSLKRRVKKLDKKRSSRTHRMKRLYKVGLTARVESFGDEEDLGKDASKQRRRINVIDADEDITLVNVQDDADNEMFDVDALNVSTAATTVTITTEEITLAQALEALKTSKPKVKGIVFQEPGKSTTTTTISSQQSQDKGKGIMIEEPVKPIKKKDLIRLDEEVALKLQAEFDEEERLAREKAKKEKEKEANIALIET
ncbi:hypothetical protein Tco_1084817 [Tanacetum coccineum]